MEKKQFHNLLQKKIKAEFGGGVSWISGKANIGKKKIHLNEDLDQSINSIGNLTIKMEGGNYMYKDNLKNG